MTDNEDEIEYLARYLCGMDGADPDATALPVGYQFWKSGEVVVVPTEMTRPAWTFYTFRAGLILKALDKDVASRSRVGDMDRGEISDAIRKVNSGYKPVVQTDPDLVVEIVQ